MFLLNTFFTQTDHHKQEDPPTLTLLSKDFHPMQVMSTGCLVNENELNFIVTDNLKNLHIFQYNPYSKRPYEKKSVREGALFNSASR